MNSDREKTPRKVSSLISLVLLGVGLMTGLASASPQSIEETTLSLKNMFYDLSSAEEANAINRGEMVPDTTVNLSEVSNETMLGQVVHVQPVPVKTSETPAYQ